MVKSKVKFTILSYLKCNTLYTSLSEIQLAIKYVTKSKIIPIS